AAFVIARRAEPITEALGPAAASLHEVARWPATGPPYVRILSNHPRLEWTDDMATLRAPFHVELHHARVLPRHGDGCGVDARASGARAVFTNRDTGPQLLRVRFRTAARETVESRVLAPGERWELAAR